MRYHFLGIINVSNILVINCGSSSIKFALLLEYQYFRIHGLAENLGSENARIKGVTVGNEAVDIKIVFKEDDVFVKESEDNYRINWIVTNAQKNKMEPIMVELGANSKTKEDEPHEGEEFGYVLSGTIMLNYGNQIYKVKKGESFYIKTNKTHFIENTSKNRAGPYRGLDEMAAAPAQ